MKGSGYIDTSILSACSKHIIDFERLQYDYHRGESWPPLRSLTLSPAPFITAPGTTLGLSPRLPTNNLVPFFTVPGTTPALPPQLSASVNPCAGMSCAPRILFGGYLLTIQHPPTLERISVKPGFKAGLDQFGVLDLFTTISWKEDPSTSIEFFNQTTGTTTKVPREQTSISVSAPGPVNGELRASGCGKTVTKRLDLLPAYATHWKEEELSTQSGVASVATLVLSRPALAPVTMTLTGTNISLSSNTVTFGVGSIQQTVGFTLANNAQVGIIEAFASSGELVVAPGMFVAVQHIPSSITATGHIEYEDCSNTSVPGKFSFACTSSFRDARDVEVWLEMPLTTGWRFYAKGRTDDRGDFAIPIPSLSNWTGQLGANVQIHIPSDNFLLAQTGNVFFEGAVQSTQTVSLPRVGNGTANINLQISGADAAPFNAYDVIVNARAYFANTMGWTIDEAKQQLHRFVVSKDGSWCVGTSTHTQQIPSNTMLCFGDPIITAEPNRMTAQLFDDETVLHEYGHHLQNMMGQWRAWASNHDGCWVSGLASDVGGAGGVDIKGADGRWMNSAAYAWFEGFPSYFAARVRALNGVAVGNQDWPWCLRVAGAAACSTEMRCMAPGHRAVGLIHVIDESEVESYIGFVLHEAHVAGLPESAVIQALWNNLRGQEPTIFSLRDAMDQNGVNTNNLQSFMSAYGM